MNTLNTFLFGLYPYICLTVFFVGSLLRFDRDQYTWKSDSSQLLRTGSLRRGSNLFHAGVLFLFFGRTSFTSPSSARGTSSFWPW
jgi:nitrate reductase gamma subunit